MTFIERSAMLKAVAKTVAGAERRVLRHLRAKPAPLAPTVGLDIEGGIGTLFTYAGLGSRELPDDILWPEDELIPLSKQGGFCRASCADIKNQASPSISTPSTSPAGECWKKTGADSACRHAGYH